MYKKISFAFVAFFALFTLSTAFRPGFGIYEAVEPYLNVTEKRDIGFDTIASMFSRRSQAGSELILDINDPDVSAGVSRHGIIYENSAVTDLDLTGADGTDLIWREVHPLLKNCGDHGHESDRCSFVFREDQAHYSSGYVHQLETNDVDVITTNFTAGVFNKTLIPTFVHPTIAYLPLILSSQTMKLRQIQYIIVGPDTYPDFVSTVNTTTTRDCEIPSHVVNGTDYIIRPGEKIIACTEYVLGSNSHMQRDIMWDLDINFYFPPDEAIVILPVFEEALGEYRAYIYEKNGMPVHAVHNIGSALGDPWDAYTEREEVYQFAINSMSVNGYQWDNELHMKARSDAQPSGIFNRFCPPMTAWRRKVDEWPTLFGNATDSFSTTPSFVFNCIIEKCAAGLDADCCVFPC